MKTIVNSIIAVILVSLTLNAEGQKIKIPVKPKIETKVNDRANKHTDEVIDNGLNSVENKIKGVFKKKSNEDQSQTDQQNQGNQEGQQSDGADHNQVAQTTVRDQPGLQSYSKYDFVPGEKVIFYEDFSQDAVGDFPALWNTNGTAEVVTTNLFPGNWMKFVMNQCVWVDALLKLPDNYTIEFDVIPIGGLEGDGMSGWNMRLMQASNAKAWDSGSAPGQGGFLFQVEYSGRPSYGTWLYGTECEQLKLSGHADGADAANLDLSKRRAASVRNELVNSFGVNGDRMETDGLGEGQPVAPNDTPANKALNRRGNS